MPFFRKTASEPEMSSSKRRWWSTKKAEDKGAGKPETSSSKRRLWSRKKAKRQGTVKKKKIMIKGWRMAEWRAQGSEKLAVARARLKEKMSHLTNWISYQVYTFTHPCSPFRRRTARKHKEQSQLLATGTPLSFESSWLESSY